MARPEHCQTWSEEVAAAFPTRAFNPLVADVSGKSVLATRFLRPLRPPPELVGGEEPLAGTLLTRSSLVSNTLPLFHPVQNIIALLTIFGLFAAAEKVSWFVSLIPYLPSNAMFPGLQDIWPTSDQFLKMMNGSEVEHAVLLTNYFNGMGKKAFLVIGKVTRKTRFYRLVH